MVFTMGTTSGTERLVKVGDVVEGRYRIIKVLGEGGMGTVFLAEHTLIKRRVAIKVLHPELATDAEVVERFMNEARAAGTLGHPNIVESTDMGFCTGHVPYIIFEYLEGSLLTDEIYRVGGLPVRRAVWIAQQIASALRAAHNAEIVHRDLKSDNIFLTDKDEALDHVKVLDFGISRFLDHDDEATRRGMVMGTPEFMSPEQITAPDSVDRRTDVYALGVILYEMLEARRPFPSDTDPRALLHRIVHEEPPPLQREGLPHALCEMILDKLLAKNPAERFQSMSDVEAALSTFITQDNIRRRRTPLSIPTVSEADLARHSDLIPRPMMARNTPWPASQELPINRVSADPTIQPIALTTPPPAKKPWLMYGVAGAGLLVGALGLMLGMRGGNDGDKVANQAPPPPTTAPAPAAATQPTAQKIEVQVDSNVPGARVTFRRRLSAAPATMQIPASDIVELVEVSAPGHKTMRYWLTFDRPTQLKATLVKGDGLVEASEEQTLVALGELAAPTGKQPASQPAAAAVVAAAPTTLASSAKAVDAADLTRNERTVAPTADAQPRRKIGKDAADGVSIEPTAIEQPKDDPKKSQPAMASPSLPEQPKVVIAESDHKPKAEEPVIPTTSDEPKADKPLIPEAPKSEPAKPAIDQATLSAVVGKNRPAILKCFAEGKKANPNLKGTLTVQFAVDASGAVKRVQVQSTITGAPMVAACVVKASQGWRFPSRGDGGIANVAYPFVIN
jgi:serine/threonine protein kinase